MIKCDKRNKPFKICRTSVFFFNRYKADFPHFLTDKLKERRAIETLHRENVPPATSFNFHEPGINFNESLRVNDLLLDDPMKTILAQNADLLKPVQF